MDEWPPDEGLRQPTAGERVAESPAHAEVPPSRPFQPEPPIATGRPPYAAPPYTYRPYPPPYPRVYAPPRPPVRRAPWYVWLIGGCLGLLAVAVLGAALIGGALAGIALRVAHQPVQSASNTQAFAVSGMPTVTVSDTAGTVRVVSGATDAVRVSYTKYATDLDAGTATRDLGAMQVQVRQSSDTIAVTTQFGSSGSGFFGGNRHVDVTLEVPQGANIEADVTAGNLDVSGVDGLVRLSAVTGTVTLSGVRLADGSSAMVTSGRVVLDGAVAPGGSVRLAATTGSVRVALPDSTAAHLDASVTTGSIDVQGWSVPVTRDHFAGASAQGDLGDNPVGTITIRVTTGSVALRQSA